MNKLLIERYIRTFLQESRFEDTFEKYPTIDVEKLASKDPSNNLKYLQWMAKQIDLGASENDLFPTIDHFHKNIQRFQNKDINSYKKLKDLEDEVKFLSKKKTQAVLRNDAKTGGEKLFEDNDLILMFIGDKASCQAYGSGTKWCITMSDANYYEQYTGANVVFYFVFDKTGVVPNRFKKIAIVVKRNIKNGIEDVEIFDAQDNLIVSENLIEQLLPSFPAILNLAKIDAAKRPKGLLAKINDGEASEKDEFEFVKLYENEPMVFEEYFSNLKSQKVLKRLSLSTDKTHLWLVADSPNTSNEILNILVDNETPGLRFTISKNPNTSSEILEKLFDDQNSRTRENVASHQNTSSEILEKLSKDRHRHVRQQVAGNPNTPNNAFYSLSSDSDAYVRIYTAANLSTPKDVVKNLTHDKNEFVSDIAKQTLGISVS